MMMQTLRYGFVLQAAQAICHSAETIGNESLLMREDVRQKGGGFAAVPIISGDAMRHGLREAAAYTFLDAAGLLDEPALSEAALRLLFAGGMVTGRGDASVISLDAYREMVDLVPSLKLLGGCTNSRVIPGQLAVDAAVLVCTETEHLLGRASPWVLDWAREHGEGLESCRVHVAEEQRVRMDPTWCRRSACSSPPESRPRSRDASPRGRSPTSRPMPWGGSTPSPRCSRAATRS